MVETIRAATTSRWFHDATLGLIVGSFIVVAVFVVIDNVERAAAASQGERDGAGGHAELLASAAALREALDRFERCAREAA